MQTELNFTSSSKVLPSHSSILLKDDKWSQVWQTLKTDEDLNFVDATRKVSLSDLVNMSTEAIYKALLDGWTIMLGYSSGKDSETVLHLFLYALMRAVRNGDEISQHHFILHTDTGIENPEIRALADEKLDALQAFIEQEQLPLNIVIAKPGITQSWAGRILTGRGLPTFSNSSARQCTSELKILPAKRAKTAYMKGLPKDVQKKVCLLLGSRDAESATRAANIAKQSGSAQKVIKTKDGGELYVIKDWLVSDVWEFLLSTGSEDRFPLPSYLENNNETAQLYKEATGECVISATEKKKSEACSSRFGCFACQAVGIDRSMTNMIKSDEEKFGYMAGLNRIQSYLSKRRYAWEDRHPIGRTIYEGGYIKLQPDVYSPKFLERLLHVCVSMDYAEELRASEHEYKLSAGHIEDNRRNRRMAEPQFRIISEAAICHIDFMWSFHHFNFKPFRALEIFHKVWSKGELDLLEDEEEQEIVPRTPIPKAHWVKVERWGDGSLFDGLADPLSQMTYFDGIEDERASRVIKTKDGVRNVVSFHEEQVVEVDAYSAEFIVWEEYKRLRENVEAGLFNPGYAAQFYLRFGAISFAKGKASMYHKMMQRGQTYHLLNLSGNQTMEGVLGRCDLKVLSDKKYKHLIARKWKAQLKKIRWWLNLDFTIKYHYVHNTLTGQWIKSCLKQESEAKKEKKKKTYYNYLTNKIWHVVSLYCSFIDSQSTDENRMHLYDYYQSKKDEFYSELKDMRTDSWFTQLQDVVLMIKNGIDETISILEEGSSLPYREWEHLDWVLLASKKQPEKLLTNLKSIRYKLLCFLSINQKKNTVVVAINNPQNALELSA